MRVPFSPVLFALLFTGCAIQLPPVEPTYDGQTSVRTQFTAAIVRNTGIVEGKLSQPTKSISIPGGGFIGVPAGKSIDTRFGMADQDNVKELLASELVKAGIIKSSISPAGAIQPDLNIELDFVKTELARENHVIDLKMKLRSQGKQAEHTYHIDVQEEDSTDERWHSTSERNKIKAKKRLLKRMIPDIEKFLSALS